jgi:phytoene dehydrogenase-like protein
MDYCIVGSGVGGTLISSILSKTNDVLMLEKEPYLGGCSSTFFRKEYGYNIGATTFALYQDGTVLKNLIDKISTNLPIKEITNAITYKKGDISIDRYKDIDKFLDSLNTHFYHKNHREFWYKLKEISDRFYANCDYYYNFASIKDALKTVASFSTLVGGFWYETLGSGSSFLQKYYPSIDSEYLDFLDNQLLIVAQAKTKDVNILTLALGLTYTFYDNFYVEGGMVELFNHLAIAPTKTNQEVKSIRKISDKYIISTQDNEYEAKNVILNSTIFDSKQVTNSDIFDKYQNLDSHQSAFVVYMTIKTTKEYNHHYQLVQAKKFANSISNSIFVSISEQNDNTISPDGYLSITISTHTDTRYWDRKANDYKSKKNQTQDEIVELFLSHFSDIQKDDIIKCFSATSATFDRYIRRSTLGGIPLKRQNLYKLPSPKIGEYYMVGDSVYPAQGWAGVSLGVANLLKVLNERY